MQLFLSILASAALQLAVVGAIPFIWWLVSAAKKERFFAWAGLKGWQGQNKAGWWVLATTVLFMALSLYLIKLTGDVQTASSQFDGLGVSGLAGAFIYAFIQTAFTEELFFRGFLLKRLARKWGFYVGNTVQSVLFALLHCAMFIQLTGALAVALITLFTGAIAFMMGYINEKKAAGSILPSWCIHGVSNFISAVLALFSIL